MSQMNASGTFTSGRKTVAAAATPEALSAANTHFHWLDVVALGSNTNPIAIGASNVDVGTQVGYLIDADAGVTLYDVSLKDVYVDVTTDGEGVTYVGLAK